MSYLLDTNICIAIIRRRPAAVLRRLKGAGDTPISISAVTLAELEYGASRSSHPEEARAALEHFVLPFEILPFDASATRAYGRLRAHLEARGTPIGPLDTLIAAHALARGLTLVTNNVREFARVPGLRVEDWMAE
jgi:tRNA(fMet)-specific endonuclease VapC